MKGIAIFVAIAMLAIPFGSIIEAGEEKAVVAITYYGINGISKIRKEMSINEAKKLMKDMESMDEKKAASLLSSMDGDDLIFKMSDNNISNYMSLIFGAGKGIALYTADLTFLFLMLAITGNAFAAILLTAVFAALTHLLPVRLAVPAMLIGLDNGVITTVGIKGVKSMNSEDGIMLIGFVGVIINFFLPAAEDVFSPFFIAGYALAALPNPLG
ncbi:MAG: hypothetical protein DRN29_02865 [Thermoplasmata archaeon]|nr:MAG: hypothetical protein DRN29_02865 [Thermoplasmata archaeon]